MPSALRRRLTVLTTAATAFALLPPGPAHGLICLDSTDCAAVGEKRLVLQDGPVVGDEPWIVDVLGDRVLLAASTDDEGQELWSSDLTPGGTGMVKDINPGPDAGFAGGESAILGSHLYFVADDGVNGAELWRTDGTAAGTTLFRDTRPGAESGEPRHLSVAGDRLYWQAYDGSGRDLWVTDGTAQGTGRVVDLGHAVSADFDGVPVPVGDRVFFVGLSGGIKHLAVTDGTAAGTTLVRQFSGGIEWLTYPRYPVNDHRVLADADRAFFVADGGTGHGRELWTSDGTPGGTAEVIDLSPGADHSSLRPVAWWNGELYFHNAGVSQQYQVYRSSGAAAVPAGWSTADVTRVLGRGSDAFFFSRSIGLSFAEVTRGDMTSQTAIAAPGQAAQSIAGGALHGATLFVSAVFQGATDRVQAFDGTTGELLAATGTEDSTYRNPVVAGQRLVVPGIRGDGPWRLLTRALQPLVSNAAPPSIAGTARVGIRLTALPGTWTPGAALSHRWLRNGVPIPGATGPAYVSVAADASASLRVEVTGSKDGHLPLTVISAARTIAPGVLTGPAPRIKGKARIGKKLTAVPGRWPAGASLTYRWYAGGKPAARGKARTYQVKAKDHGKRITVRVTGRKAGYADAATTSKTTAKVRR